jgi:hypothetical protein
MFTTAGDVSANHIAKWSSGAAPRAEIVLNGTTFSAGNQLQATFRLNESITRPFTAFAVVILPNASMLDVLTLGPRIKPVASNVPGLTAPFSYPLLNLSIPQGAPAGNYEVMAAFFDPSQPITGRQDAFLEASSEFTIQ